MVSFVDKIKKEREAQQQSSGSSSNTSAGGNASSSNANSGGASFEDKYISKSGHLIHKIKAVDSKNGRPALYFLLVQEPKRKAFEQMVEKTKEAGSMNLEEYGKIIASCYGTEPTERVKQIMAKYGFEI